MTQLLWKQNHSHYRRWSLMASAIYASFLLGCLDLGNLSFCSSMLIADLRQRCLFWFKIYQQLRELMLSISTKLSNLSMGQFTSLCSSFPPVSTDPALFIWAVTGARATVGYFWGISVPNSKEISHHIKNIAYSASYSVPRTSGTQCWWLIVSQPNCCT